MYEEEWGQVSVTAFSCARVYVHTYVRTYVLSVCVLVCCVIALFVQ